MMKNEELLKNLLRLKMQTINALIELLPAEIQVHAKQAEDKFISTLHELTAEYLQKEEAEKEDKGLKPVVIE